METKHVVFYEAPTSIVLEVKNERIICSSDNDIPGNSPYENDGDPFSH